MRSLRIALPVLSFTLALSASAAAGGTSKSKEAEPAAAQQGGPRRDPKGIKGISPFWESIKKGDDALAARDIEGAKAAYQEAIRSDPQNAMGHYRMGEAELTKGNLKEAEGFWQSALRFVGENASLKAKVLFVLADLKERQRSWEEEKNGWNAYEAHAKAAPTAKTYPATPVDRLKRIDEWKKLEVDYAAVKERIKARLDEAEKKAAESAQSPQNK
jgi:tetratricopeptide (TPR) repeat protein